MSLYRSGGLSHTSFESEAGLFRDRKNGGIQKNRYQEDIEIVAIEIWKIKHEHTEIQNVYSEYTRSEDDVMKTQRTHKSNEIYNVYRENAPDFLKLLRKQPE